MVELCETAFAKFTQYIMRENYSRIELRLSIGESFGIVKTVSSNGRIRGKTQRRRFESYTIPFNFRVVYSHFNRKELMIVEKYSQKEIAKRLIEVRDLMDFLDDGYHIKEYFNLIQISNGLYNRLTEDNQKKFQAWVQKKIDERINEGA